MPNQIQTIPSQIPNTPFKIPLVTKHLKGCSWVYGWATKKEYIYLSMLSMKSKCFFEYEQCPQCKWSATICNPVQSSYSKEILNRHFEKNLKWLFGFLSSPWVIHSFIKNWDWWTIWLRELKSSITWVLCLKCSLFTRTLKTNTETVQFTQRRKFRAIYFGIDWFSGTNLVHWLKFKALISTVSASVLVLQLTSLCGLQWSTIVPMHRVLGGNLCNAEQ